MITNQEVKGKSKKGKIDIILWAILPLLLFPQVWRMYFSSSQEVGLIMLAGLGVLIAYVDLIIIYSRTVKFYNWPSVLFLLLAISLFLARYHIDVPGNLPFVLCVVSIATSVKFLRRFKENIFLRWFGFFISVITAIFMLGLASSNLPYGFSSILSYSGSFLFLLSVIGMVFILPGSGYFNWSENNRKAFYRGIILPMGFVFCLICLIFVFNDTYKVLVNKDYSSVPWNVKQVKLFELEGVPKI